MHTWNPGAPGCGCWRITSSNSTWENLQTKTTPFQNRAGNGCSAWRLLAQSSIRNIGAFLFWASNWTFSVTLVPSLTFWPSCCPDLSDHRRGPRLTLTTNPANSWPVLTTPPSLTLNPASHLPYSDVEATRTLALPWPTCCLGPTLDAEVLPRGVGWIFVADGWDVVNQDIISEIQTSWFTPWVLRLPTKLSISPEGLRAVYSPKITNTTATGRNECLLCVTCFADRSAWDITGRGDYSELNTILVLQLGDANNGT